MPAMLLAAARAVVIPRQALVDDPHLAFVFLLGICFAGTALLASVRKCAFPAAPEWTLALGMLLLAFGTPAPFILARASAYEVAIAAGQFLLLLGMFFLWGADGARGSVSAPTWIATAAITEQLREDRITEQRQCEPSSLPPPGGTG